MAIEFQHVTKTFGDTRALEDVSLTFEEGKIYGLATTAPASPRC